MVPARHKLPGKADDAGALLARAGYPRPTPLQKRAIPLLLSRRDLCVEAPPGSGRTVAMVASILLAHPRGGGGTVAVLLEPGADELRTAQRQWKALARAASSPLVPAVLGVDDGVRREARLLAARPDVILSTPQRLIDHIRQGNVELSATRFVGVDAPAHAPEFHRDVEFILSKCPQDRQLAVFSPEPLEGEVAYLGGGRQRTVLGAGDWQQDETEPEGEPDAPRQKPGAPAARGGRGGTGATQDRRDGVTKGRRGEARGDRRDAPVSAPPSDGASLEARIKAYVEGMSRTGSPEELRELARAVRRNVPFLRRGDFAAYLLSELGLKAPVAPRKAPGAASAPRKPAAEAQAQGGLARLFINAGRSRRVYANDISDLFVSQLGIQRSELGEVRVLDNYSFVEIPSRHADRAIAELTGKELRGRKLTVDYARPREAKKRE